MEELKMYGLEELETMLGVSYRTLLKYVNHNKLRGVKIGGKWKITEENLKRFLNGEV